MLVICGWIYIKLKQTKSIDHFIWETCFLRYYFSEITVKSNRLVSIFQNNLFVSLSKGQFLNKHINDVTSAFKLKTTFEDRSILWFHKVHFFSKNKYNIYLSIIKLAVELAFRCIRTNGSSKGEIQSSQSKSAGPKSN